jgi:hypothetical protein
MVIEKNYPPPSNMHICKCFIVNKFSELYLTLKLLTTTIAAPPSNASKWQVGFNSAFKGLNNPKYEQFLPTDIYLFTIFSEQTSNLFSSAVFYADTEKHKMILLVLIQDLISALTDRII